MVTQVARWGNSLALRIPQALAKMLAVDEGQSVSLSVKDGTLIVTPIKAQSAYSLADLLGGVTPDNMHGEADFGGPVGHEVW